MHDAESSAFKTLQVSSPHMKELERARGPIASLLCLFGGLGDSKKFWRIDPLRTTWQGPVRE
jgi:hypothetical protein